MFFVAAFVICLILKNIIAPRIGNGIHARTSKSAAECNFLLSNY